MRRFPTKPTGVAESLVSLAEYIKLQDNKMNKNKSHISIVLDRSGSMASIAGDMEGGLNKLVEEQKAFPGECTLSLYKFDTRIDREYFFTDIKNVGKIYLQPRGGTALNDAIAQAVLETGDYLAKLSEKDRPALVTVIIVTDGEENSSTEYKNPVLIKAMIDEQTNKYSWHFNYLGANQDSFTVASQYGVKNVSNYALNKAGSVMDNYSAKMCSARQSVSRGLSPQSFGYTQQDFEELN